MPTNWVGIATQLEEVSKMPTGTKVDDLYEKLKAKGHSVESAVRIAQSVTGQSLKTGKKSKTHKRKKK